LYREWRIKQQKQLRGGKGRRGGTYREKRVKDYGAGGGHHGALIKKTTGKKTKKKGVGTPTESSKRSQTWGRKKRREQPRRQEKEHSIPRKETAMSALKNSKRE